MAMTAWAAKFCDQLDLLVGEWADLLAVDGDRADQLVVLEHRHSDQVRAPPMIDEEQTLDRVDVARLRRDVGNVDHLLGLRRRERERIQAEDG